MELGPRTVRIGGRRYPATNVGEGVYGGDYDRAWIPTENGNLIHVDHDRVKDLWSVAEHHSGDYDVFATAEEVNAHIHHLSTQKLSPEDIKENQRQLREFRFHD